MRDHLVRTIFAALLLSGAGALQAQTNVTGALSGSVSTTESEPVPGARLTLTNLGTAVERSIQSGPDGGFRFSALPVGDYRLLVEAEGYEPVEREPIPVTIGGATRLKIYLAATEDLAQLETLTVVGTQIPMIDIESTESTSIISTEMLLRLPVARNLDDVALLAPGTTRSPAFGLVSFGGASVAENGYYLNGMNLTNFRNGLGYSRPPFEFYREFEVKTGGYGAEFGRSTGGVVNAVTKRGGDEFEFGAGAYWEPDALREKQRSIRELNPDTGLDYSDYHGADKLDRLSIHAYGSGPIVEDQLFFYALLEYSDLKSHGGSGPSTYFSLPVWNEYDDTSEETFWGLKLDWHMGSRHLLEFTAFSDGNTNVSDYWEADFETTELVYLGQRYQDRGGDNFIIRYTGYYGRSLTLSVLAGQSEADSTNHSDADDIPVTLDWREGYPFFPTPWLNFRVGTSDDRRRMFRFDGELDAGDHLIRFGLDYEKNRTRDFHNYSGGVYYQYYDVEPGQYFFGFLVPEGVTQVAQERHNESGGGFDVINTALYIEDHWRLGDQWLLYAGIRRETFDNRNAVGRTFVEMNEQWAPRLGFSWDVRGDLRGKLYGTAGRYFLPMPSVVNMTQSGALLVTDDFWELQDLNPDGTPITGELLASYIRVDGTVPDVTELLDTDLDPTYQDEFILGYVWQVTSDWSVGVRGIYRDLRSAIEDVGFGRLLNQYAAENGYPEYYTDPFATNVLTNPGTDAHLRFDLDYDGDYEDVYFPAEATGMPKPRRTYKALELYFERRWQDGWSVQGSYTWSRARGNYEGWTNSFTGQTDGPLMTAFDLPEIMEGAYGKLPIDRPHTVKLFGSWDFREHWQVSGNFLFQSGTPYGAYGCHPNTEIP